MSNKDMDLQHSFVEKRNDGWMEVRLTKPLHYLENHESVEVNLMASSNSRMGIIVEGMEFRPLVHDGSYLMAERSANRNVIGMTHLHGTSDLTMQHDDKNEEDKDKYWEKKLPHDYAHLIKMSDIPLNYTTKKELYLLFSHGFLANNRQLWFSVCKSTCGICSILPARRVLFNNREYNRLETQYLPESRFKEVKIVGFNNYYVFTCRLESFMFSPGRSCVEKRDDGWLEARLTKPLLKRQMENLNELRIDLSLVGSKVFRFNWIIVEGVEFRPVVADEASLVVETSIN
ncbi:hypothetical protein Tco_1521833 [Tanacetum coccineum]